MWIAAVTSRASRCKLPAINIARPALQRGLLQSKGCYCRYIGGSGSTASKYVAPSSASLMGYVRASSDTLRSLLLKGGSLMYPYARSFLNTYGGMVVGGGLIVTVVYLVKTLSSTARGLLNLQENLVVYLGYASGGVLVVLAAAGIRSKYALSAKMAHRIAHRLIIRSEDPVLQSKLGGNIRIDRMRVVSRAGGYPKIQWPATMEERSKAESVCYKLIAEYEAAAESRGMNKNSSMIQQMRESLLDARRRLIGALDSAHIPSLKYKPPRAFLVFPLKGKLDRAMVSTEVVKNSGGFFGGSSYSFKLLAVDFKDSEYMLLVGNQKKYEGGVISQLRLPMLTLLTKGNTIAEQEEAEDDGMPGL